MKSNPPTMKGKVMMSKLKTAIISSVFAAGALAALIPVPVHAADRNGYGIVYNKSDCGAYGVRMYPFGGDAAGSACGLRQPTACLVPPCGPRVQECVRVCMCVRVRACVRARALTRVRARVHVRAGRFGLLQ